MRSILVIHLGCPQCLFNLSSLLDKAIIGDKTVLIFTGGENEETHYYLTEEERPHLE